MKAIKKLVVLGALATLCGNAAAANWVKVGAIKDNGVTETFYINADAVVAYKDGVRTAWTKRELPDGSHVMTLWAYKCEHPRRKQPLARTAYNKDGTTKESHDFIDSFSESGWSVVVPDSVGESATNYVCSMPVKKGTSV